ncbi:MAG TPA: hypothetical protein VK582_11995 [Pyrinomonadaceae bacterium]|nr:hypothetical protein [Pyrinomonadaceae bacterium]
MRKEYDFSKGTRGKHVGKRIRIVGEKRSHDPPKMAAAKEQVNARDLKEPEVSNDTSVKRKL